jgi:hypothetical protein
MEKIKSINELIKLAKRREENGLECFIQLTLCRSSKLIIIENDEIIIFNEIDSSEDVFKIDDFIDTSNTEIDEITNIRNAIQKGNFYKY